MNFLKVLTIFFALSLTSTVYAAAGTPECDYWQQEMTSLTERLDVANLSLQACQATQGDCTELEMLVKGLEMESDALADFLNDYCK